MREEIAKELNAELGELLRLYRVSAGKSEKDVALAASMPKAKVSGCELGKHQISVACLCQIANALSIPASELLAQVERRLESPLPKAGKGTSRTLEFMASNRGRQLIRAWSQCEDPRLLDAFTNLFLATSLQKKTEKTATQRSASVGS